MPACYLPDSLRHARSQRQKAQSQRQQAHSGLKRAHSLCGSRRVITVAGDESHDSGKTACEGVLGASA